jgi:hypothetical protein
MKCSAGMLSALAMLLHPACSEHYVVGSLAGAAVEDGGSQVDTRLVGVGLKGEYFNNITLSGDPVLTRIDPSLNLLWIGPAGPTPEVPNRFSVRWQGTLTPPTTEIYIFEVLDDDGSRVWIDDQLKLDLWEGGPSMGSAEVHLERGRAHKIKIEFFSFGGNASFQLSWSSMSVLLQDIPTQNLSPSL